MSTGAGHLGGAPSTEMERGWILSPPLRTEVLNGPQQAGLGGQRARKRGRSWTERRREAAHKEA